MKPHYAVVARPRRRRSISKNSSEGHQGKRSEKQRDQKESPAHERKHLHRLGYGRYEVLRESDHKRGNRACQSNKLLRYILSELERLLFSVHSIPQQVPGLAEGQVTAAADGFSTSRTDLARDAA